MNVTVSKNFVKIGNIDGKNLLKGFRNLNEFWKDVHYGNIEGHKKPGFQSLSLEDTFLEKPQWELSN